MLERSKILKEKEQEKKVASKAKKVALQQQHSQDDREEAESTIKLGKSDHHKKENPS